MINSLIFCDFEVHIAHEKQNFLRRQSRQLVGMENARSEEFHSPCNLSRRITDDIFQIFVFFDTKFIYFACRALVNRACRNTVKRIWLTARSKGPLFLASSSAISFPSTPVYPGIWNYLQFLIISPKKAFPSKTLQCMLSLFSLSWYTAR